MILYGTVSSRARRVLWALEETGLPYEFRELDLMKAEHRRPEYLAINPNGRVPTLVDGELVLFESAAIGLHVARKDPERRLLFDAGTAERALLEQWLFWVCTELEQALWSMGKHRFALPEAYRIPQMLETAGWEFERAAKVLAAAVDGREFLVGDRFSLADIFAGHTLSWARGFRVPLGHASLDAYADRVLARPAHAATNRWRSR